MENLTGRSLGQYELRELLGAGGMGAVYRGYQRNLRRDVAVKVLYTSLSQQSEHEERFTREAHTAAALEHAHIVPVYDYGTERGLSYVVMRLLTGGSLAERIEYSNTTGRPLPSLSEVVRITSDLASALDYAHAQGVIHRDIKDKNIMFDNQGTVFLVDFGIAKLLGTVSGLTNTGATVGTPWYMAPEQWRGDPITPAVDQYALAVTVYTMLTGKMPFEAETPYQLMHKHLNELPIPLDNWREDLPPAINDVLQRALEKEPDARYLTVMEFAQEFASAVNRLPASTGNTGFFTTPLPAKKAVLPLIASAAGSSTDPQAVAQAPAQPRSLPLPLWATAAIIAVALLIGVGVGVALLRPGQPATDPPASEAPAVAAEAITDTPEPTTVPASPTEAVVIVPTEPPTDTPPPTATATNTEQPTLTATASETATPTATVTETPTATLTETATLAPATETPAAEVQVAVVTDTAAPSVTPLPTSTPTLIPPTATRRPTNTPEPPTATALPTDTLIPTSTDTPVPPTATDVPTATPIPSTATRLPTDTPVPSATNTPIPPTATRQPTDTPAPSDTPPPTATDTPAPVVLATATPTACELADLNGSGTVDIFDVRLLARVYGSESGDDDYDAALDFDNSGTINVLDLRRITSQFGQVCATG